MELVQVNPPAENHTPKKSQKSPFIEANTQSVGLSYIKEKCVIPVFARDNEKTISHHEYIDAAQSSLAALFPREKFAAPEIRVSHQIKGRTPEAIHKNAKDLLPHEKTQYFERMAFIIEIPSISNTINGNKLTLMAGGVRAYNKINLHSKKSIEKFSFFIGFQNMVCCNLCISTDGFKEEMRASSSLELQGKMAEIISNYSFQNHFKTLQKLPNRSLTESQFAQIIGKLKLLSNTDLVNEIEFGSDYGMKEKQINYMVKNYISDKHFRRSANKELSLWNFYNLLTGASKGLYIDSFAKANNQALSFSKGLYNALEKENRFSWFLE